jgi:formylglycine-generating enzyme required for sulfatase activity
MKILRIIQRNGDNFITSPIISKFVISMIRPVVSTLLLIFVIIVYGQEEEGNTSQGMVLIPGGTFLMGSDQGPITELSMIRAAPL